jgi:hypothetical protein
MVSHNKNRPSYTLGRNSPDSYKSFFERIEEKFDTEDLDSSDFLEYINGAGSLRDSLKQTADVYESINRATSLMELADIKDELNSVIIFKKQLLNIYESKKEQLIIEEKERRIAESIAKTEEFARLRNIILNEKTRGGIYAKWGRYKREAIVIFSNGKIKAWMYIK